MIPKANLDQIAALVRGVKLPLEAIDKELLDIIVEGLSKAFADAQADAPNTVAIGSEAEVTALMESHLNRMIDEDPFWRVLVTSVGRGTESVNFDGTKLEKRPDLSITFAERSRRFPLKVEAKIIDSPSKKTVKLYCDEGVSRFENGDYAWGCREAFMLAYVRDGSSQIASLKAQLTATSPSGSALFGTVEGPTPRPTRVGDLAITRNARSFSYPCQNSANQAPGEISLWHLWLA